MAEGGNLSITLEYSAEGNWLFQSETANKDWSVESASTPFGFNQEGKALNTEMANFAIRILNEGLVVDSIIVDYSNLMVTGEGGTTLSAVSQRRCTN